MTWRRRASGGDLDALDLLLWAADELGLARRAVRKVLLVEDDVDDVVQDVLIAVAEGIDGFRGESRFASIDRHRARRSGAGPSRAPTANLRRLSSKTADGYPGSGSLGWIGRTCDTYPARPLTRVAGCVGSIDRSGGRTCGSCRSGPPTTAAGARATPGVTSQGQAQGDAPQRGQPSA